MIEVQPLTSPEPQRCPHCLATLYTTLPEGQELTEDGPPFFDSDIVPVHHALTPKQRDGFGWYAVLAAGQCPACHQKFSASTLRSWMPSLTRMSRTTLCTAMGIGALK